MAFADRLPIVRSGGPDYSDTFEVPLKPGDDRSAKELYLAGVASMPGWLGKVVVVAHRYVLRFRLGPKSAPDHLMGWRILDATPERIMLRAEGPLMDGLLVARRTESTAVLNTSLDYRRPVLARLVWATVGPVHRRVAPYLLGRATTSAVR